MTVRRIVAVAVTVGAALSALSAPTALAAPAAGAPSAKEYFLIAATSPTRQAVVAHGAFVAAGPDVSVGDRDVLHLSGGTLSITHPDNKAHQRFKYDPKTCFATSTTTGTYTLGRGTGRYARVTGHGSYLVVAQGILARTESGKCNLNVAPTSEVGYVTASGPVSTR